MKVEDILNNIKGKKILVIGDIMLDTFITGNVSRISPEAPVQVVKVEEENNMLGGAANVANNISSLEGTSRLVSIIGNDDAGKKLLEKLSEAKIQTDCIFTDERPTTKKSRVVSHSQHLIRLDQEETGYIGEKLEDKIIGCVSKEISKCDAVIVSDYAKGLITERVAKSIIEMAKKEGKIIAVDTKPRNSEFYRNITIVKPNLKEATEISGSADLNEMGERLKTLFDSNILITRGKDGMSLFTKDGKRTDFPTKARIALDISGAGDTVIASLCLALVAEAPMDDAINFSNIAAGIVVEKQGVVPIKKEDMIKYLDTYIVPKVWGEEHWLVNEEYCGKKLILKKDYQCSLHYHKKKDETFYLVKGKVSLEVNGKEFIMIPGDSHRILPEDVHRFTGLEDSEIIEFSTHHEDDDSYRIEPSRKVVQ